MSSYCEWSDPILNETHYLCQPCLIS
jgi:hypothetical protein